MLHSVTQVRRTPRSEEVWPSPSSALRYRNGQQDRAARPRQCHRSEARLSQCIGHLPSHSRGTRRLPFMVCMAQRLSPLSSWPPSLGAVLLAAPLDALSPIRGTMRPLTAATAHSVTALSACFALPSGHPALNHVVRPHVALAVTSARAVCFRFRLERAGSSSHSAESGSLSYGLSFPLRLLPTPLRSDAVTFGYIVVTSYDMDFHLADRAHSRTHSFRRKPVSPSTACVGERLPWQTRGHRMGANISSGHRPAPV